MVAHTKRHKVAQRKPRPSTRRTRAPKAHAPSKRRAPATAKEASPGDAKALKPAKIVPEEAIKPEGLEVVAAVTAADPEEVLAPRERERGSYDGDTAIKLYLREIGQVKLLTPDEEIQLALRGDKDALKIKIIGAVIGNISVNNGYLSALLKQGSGQVGTDEAGTAGN